MMIRLGTNCFEPPNAIRDPQSGKTRHHVSPAGHFLGEIDAVDGVEEVERVSHLTAHGSNYAVGIHLSEMQAEMLHGRCRVDSQFVGNYQIVANPVFPDRKS